MSSWFALLSIRSEAYSTPGGAPAVAGGPPILSPEQARRLFEDPDEFARRARAALDEARKHLEQHEPVPG